MPSFDALRSCSLLFSGFLSGFEITVHYGLADASAVLGEEGQILMRQALIRRLRVLAPMLFLPALASLVSLAIRDRRGEWSLMGTALAMFGIWIVVRIVRTVPINSATLDWQANAPPEGWREQVKTTERFHVVAAWAAVIAFGCLLLSACGA